MYHLFYFIVLHCPLSGPVLTYISLLIIPCMIVYVTNKQEPWTLNLEPSAEKWRFLTEMVVHKMQVSSCSFLRIRKSTLSNTKSTLVSPDNILRSYEVKRLVCARNWILFTTLLLVIHSLRQRESLILFCELVLWTVSVVQFTIFYYDHTMCSVHICSYPLARLFFGPSRNCFLSSVTVGGTARRSKLRFVWATYRCSAQAVNCFWWFSLVWWTGSTRSPIRTGLKE